MSIYQTLLSSRTLNEVLLIMHFASKHSTDLMDSSSNVQCFGESFSSLFLTFVHKSFRSCHLIIARQKHLNSEDLSYQAFVQWLVSQLDDLLISVACQWWNMLMVIWAEAPWMFLLSYHCWLRMMMHTSYQRQLQGRNSPCCGLSWIGLSSG